MPTVSFNVRKAKILAPFRYQVITFEHVIQINGRAYDDVTGVFTAPYNGTYLFAVQVCSCNEGEYGYVILVVDDKKKEILVVGDYENKLPATKHFWYSYPLAYQRTGNVGDELL